MTVFHASPGSDEAPSSDAVAPRDSTAESPTSVARLNTTIRDFVARWNTVWVEGEITSWNVRAGHVFARLKDTVSDAHISIRVWASVRSRIPSDLDIGAHVVAAVKADYFIKGGDLSFTVSAMKHVGIGDQLERLEKLRAQLRREGLFDPERKKALPFLPGVIGLITGEKSDAEKDVHRNAELRWPHVQFRTIHTAVQGERCVPETLAALAELDADPTVDVIIIARGGGDPQTLLGYSDEQLVRAVAAAQTPVVSAIGHENDHPLLDDVADLRASTPTDAAKRVVPDVGEQRALIAQLRARASGRITQHINNDIAQLEQLRSRPVLRSPEPIFAQRAQELFLLSSRGRDMIDRMLHDADRRTAELRAGLRALSPASTLARGYAIVHGTGGTIVRDAADAPAGTILTIAVDKGSLRAISDGAILESGDDPHNGRIET